MYSLPGAAPCQACAGSPSPRKLLGWLRSAAHPHRSSRCCFRRPAARAKSRWPTCCVANDATVSTSPKKQLWNSALSRRINLSIAVEEAVASALGAASSDTPELALVFVSSAFSDSYDALITELRQRLPSLQCIFGSSGFGVIGSTDAGAEEVEHAPALSLTLASLPGVDISLTHFPVEGLPDGDAPPQTWADRLRVPLGSDLNTSFVVLADPTFTVIEDLLAGLDYAFPDANKVGGLSSAGRMSGLRALFCWSRGDEPSEAEGAAAGSGVYRSGAAVLALHGNIVMELLVAQGCRPVSSNTYAIQQLSQGRVVTAVTDDRGRTLSPLEAMQKELSGLVKSKEQLQQLLRNLTLGVAPDGFKQDLEPHDYVIRGMGIAGGGGLVIGDDVRVGQRFRFMVRDKEGAQQDLRNHGVAYKRRQLQATMEGAAGGPPLGLLLFSCNGRGSSLHQEPDWDSRTISEFVPVPCSGFMCNGEIGKVGSTTRLHGFTMAVGLLRQLDPVASPAPEVTDARTRGTDAGTP